MTILKEEIKLLASERLTDFDDGGGSITGNEIVDGVSNNMHADVSELDRTYGRVSIIKVFAAVTSPNVDYFYGAGVIIPKVPVDPAVSATIFTTGNWSDERADARNAIESYLAQGVNTTYKLYGNHITGQKAVSLMSRAGVAAPRVDDVLVLITEEGTQSEKFQYIKIESISTETIEFQTAQCGVFKITVISCIITEKLKYDFAGESPNCIDLEPQTLIRKSVVADAASYFSSTTLVDPVATTDKALKVEDIYTQLVPSAETDNPVADIVPGGDATVLIPSADNKIDVTVYITPLLTGSTTVYLGSPIYPTSLMIPTLELTDDGLGNLLNSSGVEVATINYSAGSYTSIASSGFDPSGGLLHYIIPAAEVSQINNTRADIVTVSNRATVAIPILHPIPQKGSLSVEYKASDNWITLTDRGDGVCVGSDPEFGVATLNLQTGSLILTMGALPDVGSHIVYSWGSGFSYRTAQQLILFTEPTIEGSVDLAINEGTFIVTWVHDGVTYTTTDDSNGVIGGDYMSGTIDYRTGDYKLLPELVPTKGSSFSIAYEKLTNITESVTRGSLGNSWGGYSGTLANTNIIPNSVKIRSSITYSGSGYITVEDDGIGGIVGDTGQAPYAPNTINYTTGAYDFGIGKQYNAFNTIWEII